MKRAPKVTYASRYADQLIAVRKMKSVAWARIVGKYLYVCTGKKLRYTHVLTARQRKYLPQIIVRINLQTFTEQVSFNRRYSTAASMKYRWPLVAQNHPALSGKRIYQRIGRFGWMNPCLGDHYRDFKKAIETRGVKSGVEELLYALQVIYR
jgi:hypothetical protein